MSPDRYTPDDARDALSWCDPGQSRREWVRLLAAAKAAGLDFDDVLTWSASAPNFSSERDVRSAWRGIRADGGVTAGTLYREARAAGWKPRSANDPRPPRPVAAPAPHQPEPEIHQTLSDYGCRLWKASLPLAGTVGASYLIARHCALPPADGDLRFLPAHRHPMGTCTGPALLALVTDAVTGEPISLHQTWICADGTKPVDLPGPARLLLGRHRKTGGVIRLWPDEAVTTGLAIGEGVESVLSVAHAYRPAWSCIDAGNLKSLPVLAGVEHLLIAQDNDPAGRTAARECAARWAAAGCCVALVSATHDGADLNDELREAA